MLPPGDRQIHLTDRRTTQGNFRRHGHKRQANRLDARTQTACMLALDTPLEPQADRIICPAFALCSDLHTALSNTATQMRLSLRQTVEEGLATSPADKAQARWHVPSCISWRRLHQHTTR